LGTANEPVRPSAFYRIINLTPQSYLEMHIVAFFGKLVRNMLFTIGRHPALTLANTLAIVILSEAKNLVVRDSAGVA
jgi:hypothetical protein